ncbi:MAG: ABC transporter substrate-binding protein [Kiloniellaceae bacterium]
MTIACAAVGIEFELCREASQAWAAQTGHNVELVQSPSLATNRLGLFQQLLAARSPDIDVFQLDVIWPGILGRHFVDLRDYIDARTIAAHFPLLIENNTVGGELKAIPWFTDVGLLYYRKDLLQAYGFAVPRTWAELAAAARAIVAGERDAGNERIVGFVFQGKAYEGLTCNALEWIDSFGGGRIVDEAGRIALDNPRAVAALETAASWIGDIAPRGVLGYAEEEARGVFQSGRAVFMRNWPYAWALANGPDSPVRGRVGVAPLPRGGAAGKPSGTLGGQSLGVSRYSRHPEVAADLVRYLTRAEEQARRAVKAGLNPTIPALYEDADVLAAQPLLHEMAGSLEVAVARPSRIAGEKYNQLSSIFWNAVHDTLSGRGDAARNLAAAERRLRRLSRDGRW